MLRATVVNGSTARPSESEVDAADAGRSGSLLVKIARLDRARSATGSEMEWGAIA